MRADGTGVHRISTGRAPAWSPDGRWIAFVDSSPGEGGGDAIRLIHPDGTGAHAISPGYSVVEGGPAWAPDGDQIAYTAVKMLPPEPAPLPPLDYPGSPFQPRLYRIDIDGTGERIILPRNRIIDVHAPAWSAQNRIAFGASYRGLFAYSVTPQGTRKRTLVKADYAGWTWSPSGRDFLYGVSSRLAIADIRTGHVRTLVRYGEDPSWRRTPP